MIAIANGWCMIKIFWGGRGGDTFKTPPPYEKLFPFPPPILRCFWKMLSFLIWSLLFLCRGKIFPARVSLSKFMQSAPRASIPGIFFKINPKFRATSFCRMFFSTLPTVRPIRILMQTYY